MLISELTEDLEGLETFTGGVGDDTFEGGRGDDVIIGDSGTGGGESDGNTITITVENLTDSGGTFQTPVWFGFHDGSFDIFDIGSEASVGLERLAEDGSVDDINVEFSDTTDGNGFADVISNGGPLAPGEEASITVTLTDTQSQGIFSWATMVIPSNDAFLASPDDPFAGRVFDEEGNFLGPVEIEVTGAEVLDAGTEANLELEAAFLNQTGPNTGIEGNGTVATHLGFNGSAGNPNSENVNILAEGAETVTGAPIIAEAADFTIDPTAPIFRISVNQVEVDGEDGEGGNDVLSGGLGDDFIDGGAGNDELNGDRGDDFVLGGAGDDLINGGRGDDEIDGGTGDDQIDGGRGDDIIKGREGDDDLIGARGDDEIDGGDGNDDLVGDRGDDLLIGGAGDDFLEGGLGSDIFVFSEGSGSDEIIDFGFGGQDQIDVSGFSFASADDLITNNAQQQGDDTLIDLSGDGSDQLLLVGFAANELEQGNFIV